jgi:hypothetical protein
VIACIEATIVIKNTLDHMNSKAFISERNAAAKPCATTVLPIQLIAELVAWLRNIFKNDV